jgi:hypothetical protein
MLETLPGYGPDVQKSRAEARDLMKKLGYGPKKRLALKVSTRNLNSYRDPAVILIDQLKEIYIDGELDNAKVTRKDYSFALNGTGSGVDCRSNSLSSSGLQIAAVIAVRAAGVILIKLLVGVVAGAVLL